MTFVKGQVLGTNLNTTNFFSSDSVSVCHVCGLRQTVHRSTLIKKKNKETDKQAKRIRSQSDKQINKQKEGHTDSESKIAHKKFSEIRRKIQILKI